MADAVATHVICNTNTHYVVHLVNYSDGTGESAVVKVDKSTLLATDGAEPAALEIEAVRWNVQGFTSVRILWDHTTDDLALALSGSGQEVFKMADNDPGYKAPFGLKDPRSTGGTGDILLTTAGTTAGNSYDITLWLRKNPD